jgi:uncharacterized protein YoxC
MNNEIPIWWLILSAAFFVVNLVFFVGLILALQKVMKALETLTPKVNELTTQVSALIVKVDRVTDKVEEVADSVKVTVDSVGGRARGVAGSVDIIAQTASRQFEKFSPIIGAAMTAFRLFSVYQEMRKARAAHQVTEEPHKVTKSLLGRRR